ncbi:TonB-dependent receptor [Oxalobacteraceae bacterium CAVE-383]|nr:TonB-dependent receptor [Oxalobacteraceae bacterium CAVE-383]
MKHPNLKTSTLQILHALAAMCVVAPLVAHAQQATDLGAVNANGGDDGATSAATPTASKSAPSQSSLDARSAQSEVSNEFVRNYTSPVADFSQVLQMTPGLYSYSPNGVGLGDTQTFFRGFSDGDYSVSFDGIPFQDTNNPTHHSWVFFPSQFLGGAIVDRSPGTAATIGPANFGGSVNLLSRPLDPEAHGSVFGSYGSFNTRIYGAEVETGQFGSEHASNLLVNAHEMRSDGYQTFNKQKRDGVSLKFQTALTDNTALTLFASTIDLRTNTPDATAATRSQIAQFGDNYLMSGNPSDANYFGYNFYHVTSEFEYAGLTSNLGDGWKLDDKIYMYAYHNQQNFNGTTITTTSAIDKLNSYRTYGNLLRVSQESALGTFRTGLWSEIAHTSRFQFPSDPLTGIDAALPKFRERFKTTTFQPFAEYEFKVGDALKITPGVKYSMYRQQLTQFPDNGKTVGDLGGADSVEHSADYRTVLPSMDVHYMLQKNWSAYVQYATGDEIPPSSVFDVQGGNTTTLPSSTKSKTWQIGSVWKSDNYTFDIDVYHISFDNAFSSFTDSSGFTTFFSNGKSTAQGIEAESNIVLGGGFNLYLNGTYGSNKFASGQWVANAPSDTETAVLGYSRQGWDIGLLNKRVGRVFNDNGSTHEAVKIDPFTISNLFVNYTIAHPSSFVKQAKIQFGINNLFDKHSIVNVAPASTATSAPSPDDQLTLLPARSISLALSVDF